jgi:uncharacterized HAD superfamily protein/hypoxanthine phosphoribosyltransferase
VNFRSVQDMHRAILTNLHMIPGDVDIVVGIARSGMLPATIVALSLNVPLAEMTTFAKGEILGSGNTRRVKQMNLCFADVRHALIVDDSSDTGTSMQEARNRLSQLPKSIKLTFCTIYGRPGQTSVADITFEMVAQPRVFEWNVMHHGALEYACVDIDGVLCHDPSRDENDDGQAYLAFLEHARPRLIPSKMIGSLVTSRLEKYRPQTEAWLNKHGVRYKRLVMLNLPDAETRRRFRAHALFKGEYYRNSNAELFIESELHQAMAIVKISGKPVLSIEGPVMCHPDNLSVVAALQQIRGVALSQRRYRDLARRLAKRLLGRHAAKLKRLVN